MARFARTLGTALLNLATDEPRSSLADALRAVITHVADLRRDMYDLDHPS